MNLDASLANQYLAKRWPIDQLRPIAPPMHGYQWGGANDVLNPEPVCLNQLRWPQGAQRWATFFALVTRGDIEFFSSLTGAQELLISDGSTDLPIQMFALAPYAAAMRDTPDGAVSDLWILPLVDKRYWWQFRSAGNLRVDASTTWQDVYDHIGTALDLAITVQDIGSAYLQPEPETINRYRFRSVAELLDRVAFSLGQRIVVSPTSGRVTAANVADAFDAAEVNIGGALVDGTLRTGGAFSPTLGGTVALPAAVQVAFRKAQHGVTELPPEWYSYEKPPTGESLIAGTVKRFQSMALADFSALGSTPGNDTALSALADKIASDYYDSCLYQYDMTLNGIAIWTPTALDYLTTWTAGKMRENGSYDSFTRAQSMPLNYGAEVLFHFDPGVTAPNEHKEFYGFATVKTDASYQAGPQQVVMADGGSSGITVTLPPIESMAATTPHLGPWKGHEVIVFKVDESTTDNADKITVTAHGSDKIAGTWRGNFINQTSLHLLSRGDLVRLIAVGSHEGYDDPTWVIVHPTPQAMVSLQSASADTTLAGSPAVMPIGNGGSDILPAWLTIVSDELVLSDSVVGRYLSFSGSLGIKRTTTPPTTVNAGNISLEYWDSGFSGWPGLWTDALYIANDAAAVQEKRCPSCTWGPIKSGDKFRITAAQTAGSDTIKFMGGQTDVRLDIELLANTEGFGTRHNLP
ncbi:MAG: hypothetical protein K8T91_23140 [Planctomycetes bacterium]|nr:hypothetical protein [Planctomycetota bacterium]